MLTLSSRNGDRMCTKVSLKQLWYTPMAGGASLGPGGVLGDSPTESWCTWHQTGPPALEVWERL